MNVFVEQGIVPAFKKLGIAQPEVAVYPVHNPNAYQSIEQCKIRGARLTTACRGHPSCAADTGAVDHADRKKKMRVQPIGKIYTPFKTKEECPIQPIFSSDAEGKIEIFREYAVALKDIETFSHIYILYLFDRAGEIQLVRNTFLDDEPHGIFASRHPCRPNSIGISIVRLETMNDNILVVRGVDVLDGTRLLDIKPYIRRFDNIESASNGWVADRQLRPKPSNCE